MALKWTTSAQTTLAALLLATLIWFGCHHISRHCTIWFIWFIQGFWTCLFLTGDRLFAYVPLLRGPPDLYFDLKENPWLTSLVVYFVLPWVTTVHKDHFDGRRDCDERDESWWRWRTLQNVAKVALAAAATGALVSVLVVRRDQVRRLFFPALRRGGADFRISERGEVGCDVSSSDDGIGGNECEQSKTDDDFETPTKFPVEDEGETRLKTAIRRLAILRSLSDLPRSIPYRHRRQSKRDRIRNPVGLPRNHTGGGRRAWAGRRLGKTTAAVPREHPPPS